MSAGEGPTAALSGVMARYRGKREPELKRKPGRPVKRTPEYLMGLLAAHHEVEAWFIAEHGCKPFSDRQLYTEYFAREFTANGERGGRASTPAFQRALKTLRNELAEARRLERASPENQGVSGTCNRVK
jgi:hypothetical protein